MLALARCGCAVALTYRSGKVEAQEVCELASREGVVTSMHRADFSHLDDIPVLMDEVLSRHGKIDILVNNAGISEVSTIYDLSPDAWDRMFDVNLRGLFFCTQAVMRYMAANGGGSIVNVGSTAGAVGGYFIGAHYATTKAGVISLTKSLAKAGAKDAIRVNCVAPGLIETDMVVDYPPEKVNDLVKGIPLGRVGRPSEVAGSIVFLASDAASYITGTTIFVNGGVYM